MSKKTTKVNQMAVIDIGSNELRLRIAENDKGKMKFIESLSYPLSLGRDTFNTGKVSFERVEKACEIIKNFINVINEYGVSHYRAVATTAVRESRNRDYILDQIKVKTGLSVQVIDDAEEKLYTYKLMAYLTDATLKESSMMIYTGSGNIGLSIWEDGKIPFIQNIKVGSLRISELFVDAQDNSGQFFMMVEEYLNSFTDLIETEIPHAIKHFIASGQEIAMIANLTNAKRDNIFLEIERDKFYELFEDIKYKIPDKIADDYNLPFERAEILLPAMCIYKNLLEFTNATKIITPLIFLSDAIMFEMLYPDEFLEIGKDFDKSTLICTKAIAKKFNVMESHFSIVEKYASKIFDKMKKIHGLGKREKLLLQSAAILHDIGKFVNLKQHYKHSYNIVKGLDIIGLNTLETEIVAQICLYHSRITPLLEHDNFANLDMPWRVLVSKLTAILRIADSLDRSHEHKFTDIDVKIADEELVITITTDKNTDLEIWSFNEKASFFEDVFGIKAVIKRKRII